MNNPPDISEDPAEHEEYAHGIQKHVKGYLMVGAALIVCTALTVGLSYVNFGSQKANIIVASEYSMASIAPLSRARRKFGAKP